MAKTYILSNADRLGHEPRPVYAKGQRIGIATFDATITRQHFLRLTEEEYDLHKVNLALGTGMPFSKWYVHAVEDDAETPESMQKILDELDEARARIVQLEASKAELEQLLEDATAPVGT